jgi:hypothetical protein
MKTAFVGSWESQFLGFGRLTQFLAAQLPRYSAAVDDLGLGVVFLQRHHAELGLKLLLERIGSVKTGHKLPELLEACSQAFSAGGRASEWENFIDENRAYLDLLDEVDPGGFAYRYPTDRQDRPIDRPPFVDLEAVAEAGAAFEQSVMRVVDALARDEVVEVSDDALGSTVENLANAVRAVRSALAWIAAKEPAASDQSRDLGLGPLSPTPEIDAARTKAESHTKLVERLEPALLRVLDQLVARRASGAPELDLAPSQPSGRPPVRRGTPGEMRESMLATEKWVATGTGQTARDLKRALGAVHTDSERWNGPAARQLHNDLGRVLSRL